MRSVTIAIIAVLLILPLASAATTIKLKTLPGHDVFISIWTDDFGSQKSPPKKYLSDINGDVQHVYDGATSPFGVLVVVKSFDVQKYREEFGPYTTGETIQLPNLLPENYDLGDIDNSDDGAGDDNSTIDNSTDDTEDEDLVNITDDDNAQNITDNEENSISDIFTGDTAKTVYYVIGAIFLVAIVAVIILFIATRIRKPKSVQYGMEPVKFSEKPKYEPSGDKYLDSIEKEIDNVERQIQQYKKRNRLEDAQRKLDEKKRILERIKRGEDVDSSGSSKEDRDSKYKKRFY